MSRRNRVTLLVGILGVISCATSIVSHAGPKYFKDAPSKQELIDALKPLGRSEALGGSEDSETLSRGLKRLKHPEASAPAAALSTVQFEYDSAALTRAARDTLKTVGEAMKSPELKEFAFQIEGHTDSRGSASYNQQLSERRARSAKTFLINTVGVESSRLESVGKGESEPYDPGSPESGVNRRVQIVTR